MRKFAAFFLLLHSTLLLQAQCPAGLATNGEELVANGDFEAGNTAFTSDYEFCNTSGCLNPEGLYTVDADPAFYHSGFEGADHTSGTGNFMMVNGSVEEGKKVWCQVVDLDPNSYYIISYWLSSLSPQNSASLQLSIGGFNFFTPFAAPGGTNTWIQFSQTFQTGLLDDAEVCLINTNEAANGNDFGLDDISIKRCNCDLSINAGPDQSICLGDSVQLDGSGSVAYFWNPLNTLSCFTCEDPLAFPSVTTQYYVSVNGPSNCFAADSVIVTVFQPFDLIALNDTSLCAGESVQLNANGAVSYSWSPSDYLSDAQIADPVSSPQNSIEYFVNAVDANQCEQFDSVTVNLFPEPVRVTAGPDTILCPGKEVQLMAMNAEEYSWSPAQNLSCTDCENPVVTDPFESVTYLVEATDSNGCDAGSDTVKIQISENCIFLEIPTAFSPNNDGNNDFFRALSQGEVSYDLKIYNRWGELVFATTNANQGWDGTWNGKPQPVGVYIFTLSATLNDGRLVERQGDVTLVR
jgi:gliding motility-associated-like protein